MLRRMKLAPVWWVLLFNCLLVVIFQSLSPQGVFVSWQNATNIMNSLAAPLLLVIAITLLLGAAEFDISLGANLVLSSVIGGTIMLKISGVTLNQALPVYQNETLAIIVGLGTCVLVGTIVGVVNGVVVSKMRVNSLIATLATNGICVGLAAIITNGTNLANLPPAVQKEIGLRKILGVVPLLFLVSAVIVTIAWFYFRYTRGGLRTLAIGSDRDAASRSGINIDRSLIKLFAAAGALAGIAGAYELGRFATTNIGGHQIDALTAVAAAVIGGTALFGGKVSIIGGTLGGLLAVLLDVGFVIVGLTSFYQRIAVGLVLIVAVFIYSDAPILRRIRQALKKQDVFTNGE